MIFRYRPVRVTVAAILALATSGAFSQAALASQPDDQVPPKVAALAGKGASSRVDVVVILKNQPTTPSPSTEKSNLAAQASLIERWEKTYQLDVSRRFGYLVNGFSASIPANKIAALAGEPQVASVRRERIYQPVENSARELEGIPAATTKYSVDGTGMVVAIIDSGIDPDHQDMRLDNCAAAKIKTINPAKDSHFNCKVPSGYNYADNNDIIKDLTSSQHGMHVAGIVAANGSKGSGPDAFPEHGHIDGVAPNAQLLAMKVFSNKGGGARDSDIIAAIEDSVRLGADVINLSLGSTNGHYDSSTGAAQALEKAREAGVVNVVAAGNEGLNYSPTGGTDDAVGVFDDGTLGNPGTDAAAFTVASMDNSTLTSTQAHISSDPSNTFPYLLETGEIDAQPHHVEFVKFGREEDYAEDQDLSGKYALVERGEITFADKFQHAVDHGANGVIVFNTEEGGDEVAGMSGVDDFEVVGAFIGRSNGLKLVEALKADPQTTITFTHDVVTADTNKLLQPSAFTSWGPTPTLDFKPDIAGIGGNVYSTLNDNRYGNMSGTSMASPNVAGMSSLILQKYKERFPEVRGSDLSKLVKISLMNTALAAKSENGLPYLPRQVGAGLAQVDMALDSSVFATVDGSPSVSLREVNGARSFTVTLQNHGQHDATFNVPEQLVLTETNTKGEKTEPKRSGHKLTTSSQTVTVPAGGSRQVQVTLNPNTAETGYVEGWVNFNSTTSGQPDLAVPYLGFVGDWGKEQIMLKPGEKFPLDSPARTELVTSWQSLQVSLNDGETTFWISPNNDGVFDTVSGRLALLRNAVETRYEIADENGKLLQVIGADRNLSRVKAGDHGQAVDAGQVGDPTSVFDGYVWDPQTATHKRLPDGQYTYRMLARMGANKDWQSVDLSFGIDTVAPTITLGELEGNVLNFEATDDKSGLLDVPTVMKADGTTYEVEEVSKGVYRATIDDVDQVPYLEVTALDHGGNLGSAVKLISGMDLVIPQAEQMNDPGNGIGAESVNVVGGKLTIEGKVSERVTRVTVNGQDATLEGRDVTAQVNLREGRNEFVVVAYDQNGNEVERVTLTPYYDLTAPTLQVNPQSLNQDGKAVIAEDGTITISGVVRDERPGANLTVMVDGEQASVGEDGLFSLSFTPALDQGSVTVSVSDGANTTSKTLPIEGRTEVQVENNEWIGPNIANAVCVSGYSMCHVPGDTKDLKEGGIFTVRGETNDHFGSITITPAKTVSEDGSYTSPAPIAAKVDGGKWSADIPVKTGENHFQFVVKDDRGEVRIDQSVSFFFDVTAPTIKFTDPKLVNGTLFTNKDEVDFVGTASDDGWGYSLAINRSTALEVFYRSSIGPKSNERSFNQKVNVADGDHILVTFVDSNSNLLTTVIPVVKDQKAPTAVLEGIKESEHIATERTLTAKAEDENLASMQVLVNGKPVKTLNTELSTKSVNVEDLLVDSRTTDGKTADELLGDASGSRTAVEKGTLSYEFSSDQLKPGFNTITVESTDLAGNTTSVARTVVVDAAPQIEVPADGLSLDVFREELLTQDVLRTKIAGMVKVSDDLTVNPTVTVFAEHPIVDGNNDVTVIAVDERGNKAEVQVTVKLSLKDVTLTDGDVTAVGKFRSDETLTARLSEGEGGTPAKLALSTKFGSAAVAAVITLPGKEGTKVQKVLSNGKMVGVPVKFNDGKLSFEGTADSTYMLTAPVPMPAATGGTLPGSKVSDEAPKQVGKLPVVTAYPAGNAHSVSKGTSSAASSRSGAASLAQTGAEAAGLASAASALVVAGFVLVAGSASMRRRK